MFLLHLEICENLRVFPELDREPDYDEQYDDIVAVIEDLCEALAETEIVYFKVSGFGQAVWPVDIYTDLAVVLEQLPQIIRLISTDNYPAELNFYEQGIQRKLIFNGSDSNLSIRCISSTSWKPQPEIILVNKNNMKTQLLQLKDTFMMIASQICPKLSNTHLFKDWQQLF